MTTNGTGRKRAGHDLGRRVPGQNLVLGREGQLAWVLGACARVLRPVVRLALAFGVKHGHLEALLRDILLDEARSAWLRKGTEPNISQLSVTTGLNRKVVTMKIREDPASLPETEVSAEAKTLTLWLQMFADNPSHRLLPIASEDASVPSFESVARRASRGDVHHRAILDELVRLNMARKHADTAELAVAGFVPSGDLKGMLSFLGDNARDHLLAGVSNTIGEGQPMLERSVFAAGISLTECERIHRLARERWSGLHHELTREMRLAYEGADNKASGRIRIGIYTYYEDTAPDSATAPAPPTKPPGDKA